MNNNVMVGVIIGITIGTSLYAWNSDDFTKRQKTLLMVFIIFPPLQWLLILLFLTLKGYKNAGYVEKQEKEQTDKKDLYELKQKGLITEEEYNLKVNQLEQKINYSYLKETKEYKLLKRLLDSNTLTKQEFDSKVEMLKTENTLTQKNEFRVVDGFSEGLGLAINSDLDYGYVNINNEIIIPFIFEHAEKFIDNKAQVRINGEFKFIDYKGNFIN